MGTGSPMEEEGDGAQATAGLVAELGQCLTVCAPSMLTCLPKGSASVFLERLGCPDKEGGEGEGRELTLR